LSRAGTRRDYLKRQAERDLPRLELVPDGQSIHKDAPALRVATSGQNRAR